MTSIAPKRAPYGDLAQVSESNHRPYRQPLDAALIPDALLTIRTAGAVAGISPATIYRLANTDPLFPPLVKLGRRCTRIRAGALTSWLASKAGV